MRGRIVSGGIAAALIAGLVAVAPPAGADTGDTTPFELPNGSPLAGQIASIANGDLWIASQNGPLVVTVTTQGVAKIRPLPGNFVKGAYFSAIAQAPDGRIWLSERFSDSLSSVNANAADLTQLVLPKSTDPTGLAFDSSGNAWFTSALGLKYGRVTPAGAVSIFGTGLSTPFDITATPTGPVIALSGGQTPGLARVGADGSLVRVALPGGSGADSVAAGSDGTLWAASRNGDKVFRVAPDGSASSIALAANSNPAYIAAAPDGSAWFAELGSKKVGRVSAGGGLTEFAFPGSPGTVAVGTDGNVWVTSNTPNPRVVRMLSGITPASTEAPAITSPAGSTNGTGTVLTATNGSWRFQPTTFAQQWQRCTSSDPASCADIAGANKATYTVTDADLGAFVRANVSATNLNGVGKPAGSNVLQLAPKPVVPVQPTTPLPVAGGASLAIAPGVTAKVSGPSTAKRKAKKTYRVTFNVPQPRGAVRISLVNSDGAEAYVITSGVAVKGSKKAAYAAKTARVPRSVPKGTYTLRAVYTPAATQAATYAVATLTKPIRLA